MTGHPGVNDRAGIAVPLLLLLTLALATLGLGALQLTRGQILLSRGTEAGVQARLAAESGVRLTVSSIGEDRGGGSLAADLDEYVSFEATWRPLGSGFFFVESTGRYGTNVERKAFRTVWAFERASQVASWRGVAEYGRIAFIGQGARIHTGELFRELDAGIAEACVSLEAAVDSVRTLATISPTARFETDLDGVDAEPIDRLSGLGLYSGRDLLGLAMPVPAGVISPHPVVGEGICATDVPHNWGSPSDPGGPCGRYFPMLGSAGDLTVAGGEGQGLLMVVGDLVLERDAHFRGLVLVGGDLTILGNARLTGFVRASGAIRLLDGSSIDGSVCAALQGLSGLAGRSLLPVPGGSWVWVDP